MRHSAIKGNDTINKSLKKGVSEIGPKGGPKFCSNEIKESRYFIMMDVFFTLKQRNAGRIIVERLGHQN
jgi:hypothetical protein